MSIKNPITEQVDVELGSTKITDSRASEQDSKKEDYLFVDINQIVECEIELKSTNDLSYPVYPVIIQLFSLAVQVLQLVIMITLISDNSKKIEPTQSVDFRIGQIFVFFYAVVTLVVGEDSGLSTLLKANVANWRRAKTIQVFWTDEMNTERSSLAFSDTLTASANEPVPVQILGVFVGGLMAFITGFISLFYAGLFALAEVFSYGTQVLTPAPAVPITFIRYFLRSLGVFAEGAVIVTTAVAVVLVSNHQPDLLNILFNFCGVTVVANLDEVMMNVLPRMSVMVHTRKDFAESRPKLDEISVQYGFVVGTGVILVISFLSTVNWPDPTDDNQ